MTMTDGELRRIRAEIGSSPSDDVVADAWADAETDGVAEPVRWAAVAAQILGTRYADQVAGSTSISIPGAISVSTTTGSTAALLGQVQRLRAIAGTAGTVGVATGGRLTRPSQRTCIDLPVLPPRI